MEFRCVDECSDCCVQRRYYPDKRFGKIGVLVLPEEKAGIERLAGSCGLDVRILPRIGVSDGARRPRGPSRVLAYQLMGAEANGDVCPFLDTGGGGRSPHGGLACRIYGDRPLACRAYPLTDLDPVTLDRSCRFCRERGDADRNLDSEAEALLRIKGQMGMGAGHVWRFATGVGEEEDMPEILAPGWVPEE